MKKIFLLPGFAALFLFSACEEKPIEIPDLTGGIRRVIAEEATGVRCPQCPDGTRTLTSLQSTFKAEGRELIVISIHASGNFSVPYPNGKYDFRSPDAQALVNAIGGLEGFPSSAIDRRLLPNETSTFVNPHTRWEGVIRADFAKDYGLEVLIENDFDPATRQLGITVDIDVFPGQTLAGEHFLTVLITQDSIVDIQDDKGVLNPNYVHRHILRDVVTNAGGDLIAEPLVSDAVIRKAFSVALPAGWDEKHCSVVAFVHHGGMPDKEVLQAAERHVVE
ncbi:MAG: Omp28-related outer membrane protein [Saprospiraceae bacterium]